MYISYVAACRDIQVEYLTIIPLARMGSESIAHEAEGTPRPKLSLPCILLDAQIDLLRREARPKSIILV